MRILITSIFLSTIALFIIGISPSSSFAQGITASDSLSKNSSKWKPEEREVLTGRRVHELPKGLPFAAFSEGGEKEKALDDFIKEQKVAGLLILQDGKIRLERYAPGDSESNRWPSFSVAKSITSTLVGTAI